MQWKLNPFLILIYVSGLWSYGSYGVLVALSSTEGKVLYNTCAVVILTEFIKLMVSGVLMHFSGSKVDYAPRHFSWIGYLVLSALCYAINNNLALIMLGFMDPFTYQVLHNLKIPASAVACWALLQRQVSRRQLATASVLTIVAFIDSMEVLGPTRTPRKLFITTAGIGLMLIHCAISAVAPIFIELGLTSESNCNLHLQNMVMYVSGVLINGVIWFFSRSDVSGFFDGFTIWTWLLVLSQAVCGLCVASVLRLHGGWARLVLGAGGTALTSLLCSLVLGLELSAGGVLRAAALSSLAFLYFLTSRSSTS